MALSSQAMGQTSILGCQTGSDATVLCNPGSEAQERCNSGTSAAAGCQAGTHAAQGCVNGPSADLSQCGSGGSTGSPVCTTGSATDLGDCGNGFTPYESCGQGNNMFYPMCNNGNQPSDNCYEGSSPVPLHECHLGNNPKQWWGDCVVGNLAGSGAFCTLGGLPTPSCELGNDAYGICQNGDGYCVDGLSSDQQQCSLGIRAANGDCITGATPSTYCKNGANAEEAEFIWKWGTMDDAQPMPDSPPPTDLFNPDHPGDSSSRLFP